jgi:hypothetical protein
MRYLFIILFCCGCYLPKQAQKDLAKIEKRYPKLVKDRAAVLYPLKIKVDTIPVIKWKETINEIIKQRFDTINNNVVDSLDCGDLRRRLKEANDFIGGLQFQLNNIPRIVETIEDSSKIYLANKRLNEQTRQAKKYELRSTIFIFYSACISALLILLLLAYIIKSYFNARKR